MAYRLIYSEFWTDPRVMEEMTPEDKFFYLYILTNPSTTSCGIYTITKMKMAHELSYSIEAVNTLMERFERHHKLINYNKETRELAIKNWAKYNLSRGGKPVMDCLSSELSKVKDTKLIKYVGENIKNGPISELFHGFYETSTNRLRDVPRHVDNTDTDTNTNTNTFTDTVTDTFTFTDVKLETNKELNTSANTNTSSDKYSRAEDPHNLSISLMIEYEKLTGHVGVLNLGAVKLAVMHHGYDNVKNALSKALEMGKLNMSYVNGILRSWAKDGYPKEDKNNGFTNLGKNKHAVSNEFAGFKPREPRSLNEAERRELEAELL